MAAATRLCAKAIPKDFSRCSCSFRYFYRRMKTVRNIVSIHSDFENTDKNLALDDKAIPNISQNSSKLNGNAVLPSYKELVEQPLIPLMAMPFQVVSGGKFVIHLLQKFQKKKVFILVRAKATNECSVTKELRENLPYFSCLKLEENGISCINADTLTKENLVDLSSNDKLIIVGSQGDTSNLKTFPKVDLIVMVQPPLDGIPTTLRLLMKQNFISSSRVAIMLYDENDFEFLKKVQKHVDLTKLNPPSFYSSERDVISANYSESLPSVWRGDRVPDLEKPLPAKLPQYSVYRPKIPVSRATSSRTRLNDYVRLYVRGGSGGQGSRTYAGLGGDGGDVMIHCQEGANFDHFSLKENRRIVAGHGGHFTQEKRKKKGLRGLDVIIPVPPGTTISTDYGHVLKEMNTVGSRLLVARGGQGGSPSTEGWGGEKALSQMIRLDLRLMADVGLVGFPNAGKSSLLGELSRAAVKTGDFPFTTIRPSIGMMEFSDMFQVSIADLPGLVEGAYVNRGMGHKFLKHIDRTRLLVLVVDINGFQLSNQHPKRNAFHSLCLLVKELYSYNSRLAYRPKVLVVSKMDCDDGDAKHLALLEDMNILKQRGLAHVLQDIEPDMKLAQVTRHTTESLVNDRLEFEDVVPLSVLSGLGIEQLRQRLRKLLT